MQVNAAQRNTTIHQGYNHVLRKARYSSQPGKPFLRFSFSFAWLKSHWPGHLSLVRNGKALPPHGVIGISAPIKTTIGTMLLAAHRRHGINTIDLIETASAQCPTVGTETLVCRMSLSSRNKNFSCVGRSLLCEVASSVESYPLSTIMPAQQLSGMPEAFRCIPLASPPPGVVPKLGKSGSRSYQVYIISAIFVALSISFMIVLLYPKAAI